MSIYLAFGLNVGNVGRARPSGKDLLTDWNYRLSIGREMRLEFLDAYAHTGNYVLQSPGSEHLENIIATLVRYVPTHRFVVFDHAAFLVVLDPIRRALIQMPPAIAGRRWTPGVVMNMNPRGGIPPTPIADEKARFGSFAVPRIRTAWKGDILNSQEDKLDNTQREGGWGNLSDRMKRLAGGIWTARSMKSVEGIVGIARSVR